MADLKIAKPLACSFCGRGHQVVGWLVAGPEVFICDECIDLCGEIIADNRAVARLEKEGKRIVSRAGAERLAWMNTWTTAPPPHPDTLTKAGGPSDA